MKVYKKLNPKIVPKSPGQKKWSAPKNCPQQKITPKLIINTISERHWPPCAPCMQLVKLGRTWCWWSNICCEKWDICQKDYRLMYLSTYVHPFFLFFGDWVWLWDSNELIAYSRVWNSLEKCSPLLNFFPSEF